MPAGEQNPRQPASDLHIICSEITANNLENAGSGVQQLLPSTEQRRRRQVRVLRLYRIPILLTGLDCSRLAEESGSSSQPTPGTRGRAGHGARQS